MTRRLVAPSFLLALAASSQAFVYTQDFQGAIGSEWSSNSTFTAPADANRRFLGQFDNHSVTLTLSGLTPGVATRLAFDLALMDSWDGSNSQWGPDTIRFSANGTTLLDATFSNLTSGGFDQNYSPGSPLGGAIVAAKTGADESNTLGSTYYGDSVYKFDGSGNNSAFLFTPSSSTLVLTFEGIGLQNVGDEGWGIDNVSVSQQPVPEPATMAVLGLGALGLIRRKRKG